MTRGGFTAPPRYAALLFLVAAGIVLATEFLVRPWSVAGTSMTPTLIPGDRVLVDVWTYRHRDPAAGEVVLFRGGPEAGAVMVKRVARSGDRRDHRIWVVGDNARESLDSRSFGPVEPRQIVGRVVLRYWPPSQAGGIR